MQLSAIIVSYNVRYFLEQCLLSVQRAMQGIDAELIVVDNHSSDGSIGYLQPLFPSVRFIANERNEGFAKANNRALALCSGEYILFLNPDTLVPEETFSQCIHYMTDHPKAGALGVRMLDGRGRFLPESKRSFPAPMVSLFKLTGLAALFPHSSLFNRYALGHLDERGDHEVDVLAGAFLMVRKTVIDALGGFDERFFLYGEDIDLSYRIKQAGWQNHYTGGVEIIHFKGESSVNAPFDRVRFFYNAMLVFVQKHSRSSLFAAGIKLAIALRAAFSVVAGIIRPVLLPLIDLFLVWLSLQAMRNFWVWRLRGGVDFHVEFVPYALFLFAVLFVLAAGFTGAYDKRYKSSRTIPAVLFAMVCMMAVYAVLPETLRFSRGVMLWGGALGSALVLWVRYSLFLRWQEWLGYFPETTGRSIVVVGSETEFDSISLLLEQAMLQENLLGRIDPLGHSADSLGNVDAIGTLIDNGSVQEIIFCEGVMRLHTIIEEVKKRPEKHFQILYHLSGSNSLVGSDMPRLQGRHIGAYTDYRIASPYQRRMKRIIDVLLALFFLVTAPVQLLARKKAAVLLRYAWKVLTGRMTWVGYLLGGADLPPLKKAVIANTDTGGMMNKALAYRTDRLYARHYDWWRDIGIVFGRYGRLVQGIKDTV